MDDVDKFIVREESFLKQQIWKLISNISLVSLGFILVIGILQYLIIKYNWFQKTPKTVLLTESSTPQKKDNESQPISNSKVFVKKTIGFLQDGTPLSPSPTAIDSYLDIAKEISKVMLAQTKLLALTATIHASQEDDDLKKLEDLEMVENVKQLSQQVDHILTGIQKNLD